MIRLRLPFSTLHKHHTLYQHECSKQMLTSAYIKPWGGGAGGEYAQQTTAKNAHQSPRCPDSLPGFVATGRGGGGKPQDASSKERRVPRTALFAKECSSLKKGERLVRSEVKAKKGVVGLSLVRCPSLNARHKLTSAADCCEELLLTQPVRSLHSDGWLVLGPL